MEKGIDKLTGELAKLADQLSKAIPKGYAELVKEYALDHGVAAIGKAVMILVLIIILVIGICLEVKWFKKHARKIADASDCPEDKYNSILFNCVFGTALTTVVLVCVILSLGNDCVNEIRHMIAPNYYMLKTIVGK